MYSIKSGYVLGFHGCDESVAMKVVKQHSKDLKFSKNDWDWLGEGMYFWENNDKRAYNWAVEEARRPKSKIKTPAVLGAIISLGNCLDLLDSNNLNIVKESYDYFIDLCQKAGQEIPKNKNHHSSALINNNDKLIRNLDCSVIQTVHLNYSSSNKRFDSVRGMFVEGHELYTDSGFRIKDHIQIAVRNPNCIKGYFLPKELNKGYKKV